MAKVHWLKQVFARQGKAGRRKTALALTRLRQEVPHLAPVAQHNSYAWPPLNSYERLAQVYESSAWVYVAVNRIAEAAALVPLHVYWLEGEQRIPQEAHPAELLMRRPNPFTSGFDLLEQTVGALELSGNAYWFLAGDAQGLPAEIWPLRPDRVRVVPDAAGFVRGYVYEVDGQQIPLQAAEVMHFKRWHPGNDYYGLSALQAARLAVESDRAMATWNRNTFGAEHAVPAGIVNIQEYVSDEDFERIKRDWQQSYGGPERRTAFLRGSAVTWQSIGLNQQDVDFLNGRRFHREEVFQVFGIPLGMWSENATQANAQVGERVFIERTLWPKLVRLAGKITAALLPFWGADLVAEFEDIRPTDMQARLAEIRAAYPVLSINEIRARYFALPPVGWGEGPASGTSAGEGGVVPGEAGLVPGEAGLAPTESRSDVVGASGIRPAASPGNTPDDDAAISRELKQWERFALRRLPLKQQGQAADHAFVVEAIPEELAIEISARLLLAETAEAVRVVFQDVRAARAWIQRL